MSERKAYPSDMSDEEWERMEGFIPGGKPGGRTRAVNMREVVNGMFYITRGGCAWRMMPHDLPHWRTVYGYYRDWISSGLWVFINDCLRADWRMAKDRNPEPSAGVIDSQSVKTTEKGGPHSWDGHKQVNGRKRHVLVDTLGNLWRVCVLTAKTSDVNGAIALFEHFKQPPERLKHLWADRSYRGNPLSDWLKDQLGVTLQIVAKPDNAPAFVLLPRRWVVERSLAWAGRFRRLSKDYEQLPAVSEAFFYLASIRRFLRLLAA